MTKLIVAFRNFANAPNIIRLADAIYLRVLYGSQNTQRLFYPHSIN